MRTNAALINADTLVRLHAPLSDSLGRPFPGNSERY
jgi:hypothetical protein